MFDAPHAGHTAHLPALRSSSAKRLPAGASQHSEASPGQTESGLAAQHALQESVAQMQASPLSRLGPGQPDNTATVQVCHRYVSLIESKC